MHGRMKLVLYHPRAAEKRFRLPVSVITLATVVVDEADVVIVDADLLDDPLPELRRQVSQAGAILCVTVMPGPQLSRAVPHCRQLRKEFPALTIIWGGWFPSLHAETCLSVPYVDIVLRGRGEIAFPLLIRALTSGLPLVDVPNVSYRTPDGAFHHNPEAPLQHPDKMPRMPYHLVPVEKYSQRSWLGSQSSVYHSSFGCPLKCGFCAVAAQFEGHWMGQSVPRMMEDIEPLLAAGVNAIEFLDNNFFVSEKRVHEFALAMMGRGVSWWGEGTIDGLLRYKDETLRDMRAGGCKMIFFGAESGSDEVLKLYNKGGLVAASSLVLAERFKQFDIVPEFSFVLGSPICPKEDIEASIGLILKLKEVNPICEIIMYLYSPEPYQNSALWEAAQKYGYKFPENLEAWAEDAHRMFNMRRALETPWLEPADVARVHDFEAVLHAYHPGISDIELGPRWRRVLRVLATPRYKLKAYRKPEILKLALRAARHRRVEQEGL